jgi:hypothetical protein
MKNIDKKLNEVSGGTMNFGGNVEARGNFNAIDDSIVDTNSSSISTVNDNSINTTVNSKVSLV